MHSLRKNPTYMRYNVPLPRRYRDGMLKYPCRQIPANESSPPASCPTLPVQTFQNRWPGKKSSHQNIRFHQLHKNPHVKKELLLIAPKQVFSFFLILLVGPAGHRIWVDKHASQREESNHFHHNNWRGVLQIGQSR